MTELAREAGLQIGTASGLVDRLEASGFVERQRDVRDKRRLVLAARPEASMRADRLYVEQGAAMTTLPDTYDEHEFELLMTFLTDVGQVLARSQQDLSTITTAARML